MWILDRFYTSCAVDLRHCRAHHSCPRMQRHQFGLGLRCAADIMESASSFAEMLFKCRLERTARPCEDRNVRVFYWFRKIGADRSQNCFPASFLRLHFRSDLRAHHSCPRMQRHQFGLGLRCAADIMESASSFAEMLFKCRLERTARPCEDRNVRVFYWFRKIGADRSQNCFPASLLRLHFRSDFRDTTRGRFAWQDVGVRDHAPKGSESCCTRGSAARIP